jgi:hypothetical protein
MLTLQFARPVQVEQSKLRWRLFQRVCYLQRLDESVEVSVVELNAPTGHFRQACDEALRLVLACQQASAVDVLRMVERWNDDAIEAHACELGVHDEAGQPAISIFKGVDAKSPHNRGARTITLPSQKFGTITLPSHPCRSHMWTLWTHTPSMLIVVSTLRGH